jgi:hypothetical protein
MLFKSIMIVVATIIAAMLMVWFFRAVTTAYTREAVITGLVWLVVNWVLDTIVLVGLLGMAPLDYITQIGVRYLMIPAMVIAAGLLLMIRLNNKSTGNSRTSVIWQWYSAITCASIRKIMQKSDLIENRSTKNFPICFKET